MEDDIQPKKPRKSGAAKIVMVAIGVLIVGAIMAVSARNNPNQCGCIPPSTEAGQYDSPEPQQCGGRPRLLDLGATTCIPCKKMMPVLKELKVEYEGRLDVEFVDVWKIPGAANQFGIKSIPTQIFFDTTGKELFRHQGFFAKDEILRKWHELGVDLKNLKN
jgi:thioredoxin 1